MLSRRSESNFPNGKGLSECSDGNFPKKRLGKIGDFFKKSEKTLVRERNRGENLFNRGRMTSEFFYRTMGGGFMNKKIIVFGAAILSMAAVFAKAGDARYVAVKNAEVRASASSFAKKTGSLDYAEEVVIVSESKDWTEVKSAKNPKVSGWISNSALSKRKIVSSSFSASANELALAGKGFNDELESEYKKSGGSDFAAVDAMENQEVSRDEVKRFMVDGNLKTGETK